MLDPAIQRALRRSEVARLSPRRSSPRVPGDDRLTVLRGQFADEAVGLEDLRIYGAIALIAVASCADRRIKRADLDLPPALLDGIPLSPRIEPSLPAIARPKRQA